MTLGGSLVGAAMGWCGGTAQGGGQDARRALSAPAWPGSHSPTMGLPSPLTL